MINHLSKEIYPVTMPQLTLTIPDHQVVPGMKLEDVQMKSQPLNIRRDEPLHSLQISE